jgi:hypothetical protein
VLAGFLCATSAVAQTCMGVPPRRTCLNDGDVPYPHRIQQFAFDTNSHIEKSRLWHFDVCVQNRHPQLDLQYAWFVPKASGWLPPNEYRESCHYSDEPEDPTTHQPKRYLLETCFEYGNVNRTTGAQLYGDTELKRRADQEGTDRCQLSASSKENSTQTETTPRGSSAQLEPLSLPVRLFLPSDSDRPAETMLTLAGTFELLVKGPNAYVATLRYGLSRYPGRENGDSKGIQLHPIFEGAAEQIAKYFQDIHPTGRVSLLPEGEVSLFFVTGGNNWQLGWASLQFLDRANKIVASAEVPVFIPTR